MTIHRTRDGIIRAGGWLWVDGAWLWRGLKFARIHETLSEAAIRRHRGVESDDYDDEMLSCGQREVVTETLRSLGHE